MKALQDDCQCPGFSQFQCDNCHIFIQIQMLKITLCLMVIMVAKVTVAQQCIEYVVDDECATWSQQTGKCITCISGFQFNNGKCLPKRSGSQNSGSQNSGSQNSGSQSSGSQSSGSITDDANCGQFKNGKCVKCAWRAVNVNGKCTAVSSSCATWDEKTALCKSCYGGHTLTGDGKCFIA